MAGFCVLGAQLGTVWRHKPGSAFARTTGKVQPTSRCSRIRMEASTLEDTALVGLVLAPSTAESRCDNLTVAGPVVVHDGQQYLMWYYCQSTNTSSQSMLPLGDIALATSQDGLTWTRQEGPLVGGSVLAPRTNDSTAFDSEFLGCSSVIRVNGKWHLYYSGGVQDGSALASESAIPGFPMRAGLAVSEDGVAWERVTGSGPGGSILDVGADGEHDALFIGWPSVVQVAPESFVMIYHSAARRPAGGLQFSLARAVSTDGVEWRKTGLCSVTGGDESEDAFDAAGLGTRDVVMMASGELMMYAEGVDNQSKHRIGAFLSQDLGQTWRHCNGGRPVISAPGKDDVGTACVVRPHGPDSDEWWVYCVTVKNSSVFGIALAVSESGPHGPFRWHGEQ